MKNPVIIFAMGLFLTVSLHSRAQEPRFITSGIIEYERTENTFAILKKTLTGTNEALTQPLYDNYIQTHEKLRKLTGKLTFDGMKTLFTPGPADPAANNMLEASGVLAQINTIYTDLAAKTYVCQKQVYDAQYLISDSVRKIHWKMTDETREIAGIMCRRANAIVMDSVYVVAFYTDRIPVSGGPESFTGLPGMILGLAIPHENVSWFATKVTDVTIDRSAILPPVKGKPINYLQLRDILTSLTQNIGKNNIILKILSF